MDIYPYPLFKHIFKEEAKSHMMDVHCVTSLVAVAKMKKEFLHVLLANLVKLFACKGKKPMDAVKIGLNGRFTIPAPPALPVNSLVQIHRYVYHMDAEDAIFLYPAGA